MSAPLGTSVGRCPHCGAHALDQAGVEACAAQFEQARFRARDFVQTVSELGRKETLETGRKDAIEPGRKDDQAKLRYDLMPLDAERSVVEVLTYGARKYSPENWWKVPDLKTRYHAAARRHIAAWAGGEQLDPESRLPHLAHAMCCLLFVLQIEEEIRQELKDRHGS